MNPFITAQILADVGITVNPDEQAALLTHLNTTLEERVGVEITDSLNESQLDELAELQEADDEAALQAWMVSNVPEMNDIIQDEIDILLAEIAENTDGINQAQA